MRLTLVVIKKYAGRAVQLGNNNAFRAVNHKGSVIGHKGYLTHVDLLLLHILNGLVGGFLIVDDQTNFDS